MGKINTFCHGITYRPFRKKTKLFSTLHVHIKNPPVKEKGLSKSKFICQSRFC